MHNKTILLLILIRFSLSIPPFSQFEGYGTQSNIKIFNEVVATDQLSLHNIIKSHTYIRISNVTINLKSVVWIKQLTDVIIQGPATLVNYGIYIQNSSNIVIHNLRILNASIYGLLIYNSTNIVINSMTILDASRSSVDQGKCVDITQGSTNITISNSILGYSQFSSIDKYKGMLIANFLHDPVTNVSIHHNIFYQNYQRSPEISTFGLFDFRNNIIYGYTQYGSRIRQSAYGNFQANYYIGGKKDPIVFLDNSTYYSFSSNNHWKYNYTQWKQIPEGQHIKYDTPYVKTYDYPTLINQISKYGCQPQGILERTVKNAIRSNTQLNKFLQQQLLN